LNPERYVGYDVHIFKEEQNSGCIVGMGCQKRKTDRADSFTVMKEGLSVKDIFCPGKFVIPFHAELAGHVFRNSGDTVNFF
jgi:hypothetical protein